MDQNTREQLLALFQGKLNRTIQMYLETCTRCGVCTPACHAYASIPVPRYTPAHRAEVVRRIYKKYFKAQGKVLPLWGQAKALDDTAMAELFEAAYSCTGCRRCMVYCPFGIDTQQITAIAKLLLVGANMEPEVLSMLADVSISKGESIDEFKEGFIKGIERLEKQVVEKWKSHPSGTPIPLDVEGADLLYVALAGAHSIIPAAAVFNAAGEKWSLSFFEAVNFGAFVGDPTKTKIILDRIINEARRLKVKEVSICECGTAFRVMKQLSGSQPFYVSSLTEVHARYIRDGRIKLDKNKIDGSVTYHDPCQIARNGGVIDEPRYILSHLTDDYREMSPDPRYNWCCGGGGGLVALGEETYDFRMKSARVKAEQAGQTGAKILATACENCQTQLDNLNEHYKLGMDVRFLSSMVADALVE
ncbi:MAG: (Fe-S)-binding protein [Proteobacteria bacterium]|nr:(Fe-S)-binding protein [Pseudomonadota bacterium]